ncbi:50S ribosomal protein L10 [Candidatus Uhrbacteria bacterium]|nr:50S ribosomal protein L10 [Candidatus Uhrbacteria bacterium]
MARSKQSKQDILEKLADALGRSVSVVFASVKGLKVYELEELRKTLRTEGNECFVAKKTLLSRAFSTMETKFDFRGMDGEVAAVFGYTDQVAPARVLSAFGKTHEKLTILAGFIKDEASGVQSLTSSAIAALALLPSRDELRARVVGSLAAPLRNCVGVLQGPLRAFAQVLNAYAQTLNPKP